MELTLDGQVTPFIEVREFRAAHHLPETFGIALFEPKDTAELGSIADAGAALNDVRDLLLAVTPELYAQVGILDFPSALGAIFRGQLAEINAQVGLRQPEIDFAVAGLEDLLRAVVFALIRTQINRTAPPAFEALYAQWVNESVRVSARVHAYHHDGEAWSVQIVNTVYGRVGLIVRTPSATYHVHDTALTCPADGYMAGLLREIAALVTQMPPAGGRSP